MAFWLPHPVFCQLGTALSHCCDELMSPLLNAEQRSWSLSLQFKEDGSVVTCDQDHVGSDGLPFLSGEPPLQKEEMVKCPCASLDSASSGCHHPEWPSGLGMFRDRSQGYDQEPSRVPGVVAVTWNGSLFLVLSHLCVLFLCC